MAQKNIPDTSVLKSASVMGLATFLSRIMGLVREQVFAVVFGAGNLTDAFNIAFRIPNLLRDLFAEGALSAAFVPTFTRVRVERGERDAWRVAGLVFRALLIVVSLISILGILYAPELVGRYAGAFKAIPGKFEVTVFMTRILFPFFPLVALAAAFMGILNANGKFFLPAFASALFNVFSVIFGLIFAWIFPRFGIEPIVGMAVGVVIGGAIQSFSQLPVLYQVGYRWEPKLSADAPWYREPALGQMLLLMLPSVVGLAATQVNVFVNSMLATSQGPGAVSWLNYAFRLMQFPIGIFGVSLASATLPRISKQFVEHDHVGVRNTLTTSLKTVFAVNLPASAGLAFLGIPIIQMLFQYGRFHYSDTVSTAHALAAYSVGLTAYSAVKVLVPACYAMRKTAQAVTSSVLSVLITVGMSFLLVGRVGFWGLSLSTSIAAFFNFFYLCVVLRRFIHLRQLVGAFLIHLIIALGMGVFGKVSWDFIQSTFPDEQFILRGKMVLVAFRLARVSLLVAEGAVFVLWVGSLFKIPETRRVLEIFSKKLKNKISGPNKSG